MFDTGQLCSVQRAEDPVQAEHLRAVGTSAGRLYAAQCLEVTGVVSEQTEGKVFASIKACVTPSDTEAGFRRIKHAFVGGRSAKGLSAQGD